ncbi:hypothetical protein LTR65_004056 [Meristemomyces frigidus]
MQANSYTPQYALNGGVLQNGYRLQHYRHAGNRITDGLAQKAAWLRSIDPAAFQAEVQRAQQMLNEPRYQQAMSRLHKQPEWQPVFSMPKPPDLTALIATGDRDFAVATIEQYLQQYAAWMEQSDPGGLRAERGLELVDRGHTEVCRKRREKLDKQPRCVVQ